MKLTFRYNSMLNFIQASFCFLYFSGLGLGSVIGLGLGFKVRVRGSGSITLKNIFFLIFDRWRCKHIGHSLSRDACDYCATQDKTQPLGENPNSTHTMHHNPNPNPRTHYNPNPIVNRNRTKTKCLFTQEYTMN